MVPCITARFHTPVTADCSPCSLLGARPPPQASVFEEVSDLVQSALDGYKVCLFSYGQTGAGKTHTMQGSRSHEGQGIIPRAISKVWDQAGSGPRDACCTSGSSGADVQS